jgi:TDG/mug DNA glycosylase family protein
MPSSRGSSPTSRVAFTDCPRSDFATTNERRTAFDPTLVHSSDDACSPNVGPLVFICEATERKRACYALAMRTRPTRDELLAARDRTLADLSGPGMRAVFCGINPSLYSAAVGFHFARPGNRFWPAIARAGITERLLVASEQRELLARGYGITNVVARATARADELHDDELVAGARTLGRKIRRWRPRALAVLGATAFRIGFGARTAKLGPQDERIGDTIVWVLPNPSGLNAHYQVADLAHWYAALHRFVMG